jgi:uncharacterized protein
MSPEIAERAADGVVEMGQRVRLVWHAGEPLACGIAHFQDLLRPFCSQECAPLVSHSLQTNGTLMDKKWCQLFKDNNFEVGVSIDGPPDLSSKRVNRRGQAAFPNILRGIECLKENSVRFAIIAVIGRESLLRAEEIYDYACQLGCWVLGINLEETEGPYIAEQLDRAQVVKFWRDLYEAWRRNPVIQIREFARSLHLMREVSSQSGLPVDFSTPEIFPCISTEGDVILLSPEFIDNAPHMVVGNLASQSLSDILRRSSSVPYLNEFLVGIGRCRSECGYFQVCGGGAASNRYFEKGRLDVAETDCCRHRTQYQIDALLEALKGDQ